jgi:DNA-binding beta-propeller fold protein YncE
MRRGVELSVRAFLGAMVLTVATVASAAPAVALTQRSHEPLIGGASFGFGSALMGSAPVGNGPSLLAVNPATHTIYVSNGSNNNGPAVGGDTVSVVDARHCNARDVWRCKGPWPTITVGDRKANDLPSGIAIDEGTDTVYVTNVGDNSVSVFNGATCNSEDTRGCVQRPREVPVGLAPLVIFADRANHTLYVANLGNGSSDSTTVSMIDSATCNATDLTACPTTPPPTVNVGATPINVDVNETTHTAYVTTVGTGSQNGWAAFDTNTCNATAHSGCHAIGRLAGNPAGPNDGEVDPANNTLYTANFTNTISVFDLRRCQTGDLGGCASDTPGTVTPFPDPGFQEEDLYVAVDRPLHSVYVSYQKDAALVVVDASVCNGRHLAACARLKPPTIHTGADPQGVVLDGRTQTLYTANQEESDISVIDATRCNARDTNGCRHPAPSVSISEPGALAADDSVDTAYVPMGSGAVAMINTQNCRPHRLGGCRRTPPHFTVGKNPSGIAIDPRTHTVYISDLGAGLTGAVSVVDDRTCNASHHAGCAHQKTLRVPRGNPDGIAVDPATDTIYVTTVTRSGPNLISVFNGATCNAHTTHGCGQTPALLKVGDSGKGDPDVSIAVNQRTNTIYATNVEYSNQTATSVFVFNAATCDAADTAGCGQTPATITVGQDPRALVADPKTDTVYAVNHAAGDFPGTVSVINGAACNGHNTDGCGQIPATTAAGLGAIGIALNTRTHRVYVTNLQDASVSVINGATCNAVYTSGCHRAPGELAVGNYPGGIAVDAAVGAVYVSNLDSVSVVPIKR